MYYSILNTNYSKLIARLSFCSSNIKFCRAISNQSIFLSKNNINLRLTRFQSSSTTTNSNNAQSNRSSSKSEPKIRKFLSAKLFVIFSSGALTYLAFTYYLETYNKSDYSNTIDYSSKNLPGRIEPHKKVSKFSKIYVYLFDI
jgi:hypothetical protein